MKCTKAMLFSAGLGTRLRPLTNDRPKALVEIKGKTLLEWNILNLEYYGIQEIIINIHHFADVMREAVADIQSRVKSKLIISDESDAVLETGGGLLKAKEWFAGAEMVLLHNVDILSNVDLNDLVERHCAANPMATLVMQERYSSRNLLFDDKDTLVGWKNNKTDEYKWSREEVEYTPYAFAGIQIVSSELMDLIPFSGKFSIIDVYLHLASNHVISACKSDALWFDVGTIDKLETATANFEKLYTR